MDEELCAKCNDTTGKAGPGDGSLYTDDGEGPYCETCFALARVTEERDALKSAAIVFGGQGHRIWCQNSADLQRPRTDCECGLTELQDVIDQIDGEG